MTTVRSLRAIPALAFVAGGVVLLGFAGWFTFWSFRTDYPEARFDSRVYAVINTFYALVFLVGGMALRRSGRPGGWSLWLALLGFLAPGLYHLGLWLYDGAAAGELRPARLAEQLWSIYGPPFFVNPHLVLYGCALLAVSLLITRRGTTAARSRAA